MKDDGIDVGFDVYDLTGASAAGGELSPLRFDRTGYTPFEEFLQHIAELPEKPVRVHKYALSRNGRVVSDAMDKYLSYPAESSSLLKEALKSPRHYLIAKNQELKPKNTDHFELGTFCHAAFLEPSKFDKVRVLPKANRSTSEGVCTVIRYLWELLGQEQDADLTTMKIQPLREKADALLAQARNEGYTFIGEEDLRVIDVVRASYKTYGGGILPRLLRYAIPETSMYGKDASTGLAVKIRPDAMILEENLGVNIIVSFKTTSASSVETFMRDCAKFRYELSEGMYLKVASQITGRQFTGTLMVMLQTVIPYQVAVFYWDAEDIEIGKYKYEQALDIVKQCRDAGRWPGFDAKAEAGAYGIIQCKLPDYIRAELLPQYLPE